ncbi:hypothetical protein ACFWPU_00825 [Streptomyces sp. NPDC058471]|uniref:hypothetical protein n=1 Tax=Streptomyces sp. NPDC058471 TaxID=3346516 RepID=UPI0036540656
MTGKYVTHRNGGTAKVLAEHDDWYWLVEDKGRPLPFSAKKENWTQPTPRIGDVWTNQRLGIDVRILGVTDTYAVTIFDESIGNWNATLNLTGYRQIDIADDTFIVLRATPFPDHWTMKERQND